MMTNNEYNYKKALSKLIENELQNYFDENYNDNFIIVRVKETYYNEKNGTFNIFFRLVNGECDNIYYIANVSVRHKIKINSVKRLEEILEGLQ
ncbi:MAG: hypothetical protein IKT73_07775 [Anaerotignum sp.]|nr:hypothetical protein [Anaerotignum sp.]